MMVKKSLILGVMLALGITAQTSYRFVVLGDRTSSAQGTVFETIRDQAMQLNPPPLFYTNVGDLIEGYTRDTVVLCQQWEALNRLLAPIKEKGAWHPVPGNHDITYGAVEPFYRRYAGAPCTTYSVGPDFFIVLNTALVEEPQYMGVAERQFLAAALKKGEKARFVFCFYHKPFYRVSPKESMMDSLHAMFVKGGVDYVVNGHYHHYMYGVRDGIHYVTIGSSGGETENKKANGSSFHYGLFDVTPSGVLVRPVTLKGETLSVQWMTDSVYREMEQFQNVIEIKPVLLSWKDSLVQKGVFDLMLQNPFARPQSVLLKWEPKAGSTDSLWSAGPLPLEPIVLGARESRLLRVPYEAMPMVMGPRIKVKFPYREDTVFLMKRPLIRKQMVVAPARGVVVDGALVEPVWQGLQGKGSHVFRVDHRDYDSTWIGMAYDQDYLTLGFECFDPSPESLVVATPEGVRDSCDSMEDVLFFTFSKEATDSVSYLVYANSVGAVRDDIEVMRADTYPLTKSWQGIAKSRVVRTKTGWQGEMQIPWKAMGMKKKGSFYFNCKRTNVRWAGKKRTNAFQMPLDWNGKASAVLE